MFSSAVQQVAEVGESQSGATCRRFESRAPFFSFPLPSHLPSPIMNWIRELHSFRVQPGQADEVRSVRRKVMEPLSETALNPKFFLEQIGMPHLAQPTPTIPIYQVDGASSVVSSSQRASTGVAEGLGHIESTTRFSKKTEARLQAQCVTLPSVRLHCQMVHGYSPTSITFNIRHHT